jgi:hypothetical protein
MEWRQETAMPLAQVLQFDQRQAIGRRRPVQAGSKAVIVQLFRAPIADADPLTTPVMADEQDGIAGRGRDPG